MESSSTLAINIRGKQNDNRYRDSLCGIMTKDKHRYGEMKYTDEMTSINLNTSISSRLCVLFYYRYSSR